MNFKINTKKILYYIVMIILMDLIYWYLINDTNIFPSFFYLDKEKVNIENLMYYSWQVQVTIALISISLTSLIISKLDERIYGQTLKDIIMGVESKHYINYIDKIVMVILISVMNMWFIIYNNLPGVMINFLITIYAVLNLITDTCNILFNSKVYEERVKNYIYFEADKKLDNIKKVNEDRWINKIYNKFENNTYVSKLYNKIYSDNLVYILDGICVHNRTIIESNSINDLEKNLNFIYYIFNIFRLDKVKSIETKELLSHTKKILLESVENLLEYNHINEVVKVNNFIISKDFYYLDKNILIKEILQLIVQKYKNTSDKNIYLALNKYMLKDILNNINVSNNEINVAIYQIECFKEIYRDSIIERNYREDVIVDFINFTVPVSYKQYNEFEENNKKGLLLAIIKHSIDRNDSELYKIIINKIYEKNAFEINFKSKCIIYDIVIIINIYLYYILEREEDFEEDFKNSIKPYLNLKYTDGTKYNFSVNDIIKSIGKNIWDYYSDVYDNMRYGRWECTPKGDAKALVITDILIDFYLFYTIVFIESYDYRCIINGIKQDRETYMKILSYFNSNGVIKNEIESLLIKFIELYGFNYNKELKKNTMIRSKELYYILYTEFTQLNFEEIKEELNNTNKIEKINTNISKIKLDIQSQLLNNELYRLVKNPLKKSTEYGIKLLLDNLVLSESISMLNMTYSDAVVMGIEQKILELLTKKLKYIRIYAKDKNKIQKLLKELKDNNLNINTTINHTLSEIWYIKYNESTKDIEILDSIEENIKRKYNIGINRGNEAILLDAKNLDIKIKITELSIDQISEEEIRKYMNKNKKSSGNYGVNDINNIVIELNEEQAKSYLKLRYNQLDIKFKVDINSHSYKGLRIVPEVR